MFVMLFQLFFTLESLCRDFQWGCPSCTMPGSCSFLTGGCLLEGGHRRKSIFSISLMGLTHHPYIVIASVSHHHYFSRRKQVWTELNRVCFGTSGTHRKVLHYLRKENSHYVVNYGSNFIWKRMIWPKCTDKSA